MSQREGPQSQVGGSVGNSSQYKLDGLDHLVNEESSEALVMLLLNSSLRVDNFSVLCDIVFHNFSFTKQLILFVFFISFEFFNVLLLAEASNNDRLDTEHEGYCNDHHSEENIRNRSLSSEEVHVLKALLKEVVDHSGDDRRGVPEPQDLLGVGGVGVKRVEPLAEN